MAFWITATVLTFAACMAILVPVVRARPRGVDESRHHIEVYRDQLREIDRDLARGLIAADDAEQARAEIGRRALKADAEPGAAESSGRARLGRAVAASAVLMVPLLSWGLYAGIGSPDLPPQPLAARISADPAKSPVEELVARAEAHLAANPDDGNGWDVLAPVYLRVGRAAESVSAYRNAIRLLGASAVRESGLGEALATAAAGRVTDEALGAFQRALALEPGQDKARFFTALAVAQAGRFQEAAASWTELLAVLPSDSAWREPTQTALAEVSARLAGGPTESDVAAAQEMSPEDRTAMVEAMVAQLDSKLRENPADREGWKRLVRSYVVLGRQPDALDALTRGVNALGAGTSDAADLLAFSAGLGLTMTE